MHEVINEEYKMIKQKTNGDCTRTLNKLDQHLNAMTILKNNVMLHKETHQVLICCEGQIEYKDILI